MLNSRIRVLAVTLTLGSALLAGLGGCQKNGASARNGSAASAYDLYTAGKYQAALAAAERDYREGSDGTRPVAALTAGLSCHALGRIPEALRWLEPLARSDDPNIAGRASATLGMIAQKNGQNAQAADLLCRGAAKLTGDNAARTWVRAGHAYTALKDFTNAKRCYDAAMGAAESPNLRAAIEPFTKPGPFAVQVGVFASKPNADRKANEIAPAATKLGFGPPQIVPTPQGGRFMVRVGSFLNRQAAAIASQQLSGGAQKCVVVAE